MRVTLLGLRRVKGSHSGENTAERVVAVVGDYEIESRLGYFVLDNADTNDTCVAAVLGTIRPDLQPKEGRLRCLGHIINLAAKALLFGTDAEAFELEVLGAEALEEEIKELDLWRRKGPVGKLHNVVKFILKTPQRREEFLSLKSNLEADLEHLQVVSDQVTRWNSAYNMICHDSADYQA